MRGGLRGARELAERAGKAREAAAAEQPAEERAALVQEPGVAACDRAGQLRQNVRIRVGDRVGDFLSASGRRGGGGERSEDCRDAAAASFCATASLIPSDRARLPINCGVRNWDTRLTRLIAITISPRTDKVNDRQPFTRLSRAWRVLASKNELGRSCS